MISLLTGATPPINIPPSLQPTPPAIVQKAEPKKIKVVKSDTLTKIAKQEDTTVERLWQKNTQLTNPDLLEIGQELTIPLKDEVLPERPNTPLTPKVGSQPTVRGSGNDQYKGYCTWHVMNLRPDLPRGLGNANTWFARAQAFGLPTGSEPRVGAVATTTRGSLGHVSYVLKVEGGRIYVSEMNVVGWNIQSNAWYPASDYLYIY